MIVGSNIIIITQCEEIIDARLWSLSISKSSFIENAKKTYDASSEILNLLGGIFHSPKVEYTIR
jgi:hypothetical protein